MRRNTELEHVRSDMKKPQETLFKFLIFTVLVLVCIGEEHDLQCSIFFQVELLCSFKYSRTSNNEQSEKLRHFVLLMAGVFGLFTPVSVMEEAHFSHDSA